MGSNRKNIGERSNPSGIARRFFFANADFFLLSPTMWSLVPGYLKETSVLSFDDVVFSKEGFLDDKNVILL